MASRPFEFFNAPDGDLVRIALRGRDVLSNPLINFGTAFSLKDREELGVTGLLPQRVMTLDGQLRRVYEQYCRQPDNLSKYVYLSAMQDRNEVLFYRLLTEHIEEMLPIVYTPTIGEAIQVYSHWFHRPRGVFLSIDDPDDMEQALLSYGHGPDDVDLIVATDSEGILGIGDQGVGGIAIAVGKLSVYTAAAGIHPRKVLPVLLDVGTNNHDLLNDEAYLGNRHARVRDERYDEFIQRYVDTATRLFPHAMLHWEDFGAANAHRILSRYRGEVCTFNDDIQGTAAIVVSAILGALKVAGTSLAEQRVVIHGAGTAGVGIADLLVEIMVREGLTETEARSRFWGLGSRGLLREGIRVRDFQEPYARTSEELKDWKLGRGKSWDLADVVRNVQPTILIGTSAQAGCFSREIVQDMASHTERPIIMPLSNPTSLAEAQPKDLLEWTDGRALIATGSPFEPVIRGDVTHDIAQANNALVFPGIGLGVATCHASRVTQSMIVAAAEAVAQGVNVKEEGASVLPGIEQLRAVSARVALAVIEAAQAEGLARKELDNPIDAVYLKMWRPVYPRVEAV